MCRLEVRSRLPLALWAALTLAAVSAPGCREGDPVEPDRGEAIFDAGQSLADSGVPAPDLTPDQQAVPTAKIAAVQYGADQAAQVSAACTQQEFPDICAVAELVKQAQEQGALLVVTPEYALDQKYYEPVPEVGENPGTSSAWQSGSVIKRFSQQAKELAIYLVIDLLTYSGSDHHNTAVAFTPEGAVGAVHHKYNLYGGEAKDLAPGTEVTVMSTPFGNMGMLICADIYGSAFETLRKELAETLKARVVALPTFWAGPNQPESFFESFARKYKLYVAASNHSIAPYVGGGILDPSGDWIAHEDSSSPKVIIGEVPLAE